MRNTSQKAARPVLSSHGGLSAADVGRRTRQQSKHSHSSQVSALQLRIYGLLRRALATLDPLHYDAPVAYAVARWAIKFMLVSGDRDSVKELADQYEILAELKRILPNEPVQTIQELLDLKCA